MNFAKKYLATFFGAGFCPVAPGTMGTLGAAILYILLHMIGYDQFIILLSILILSSIINIWVGGWAEDYFKTKDPHQVVIDEVAGYFLTIIFWQPNWQVCLLGFLAFRLFDITKPFPIRIFEQWPKGWGILFDDLMAAVYAALLLLLINYLQSLLQFNIGIVAIWQ